MVRALYIQTIAPMNPQTNFRFACLCLFAASVLLHGCAENDDDASPPPVQFESGQIEGILYYYTGESAGRVRILDVKNGFRIGYTLGETEEFTIDMQLIADERGDDFVIKAYKSASYSPAYPEGRFIKPKTANNAWLFPSNVIEYMMYSHSNRDWQTVNNNAEKLYAFVFHRMDDEDGEAVYSIESMYYPGRFISHQGHAIQGTNELTCREYPSKESAPRWRLFKPAGVYIEGNPLLVSW